MYQSSSSDSSDFCERFKNVRSLLVNSQDSRRDLDENYAYKRKLGDLIFNADYEGGNLGNVEQVDLYDYDLMVRPDVTNPRHRSWFNFTVGNQRANQCVIFTFVNLSENLSLFNEGLAPVVRSREKPNWLRLNSNQVFYYRSWNHGKRHVLSIAFRFDNLHDNEHQFALFYPYTITNLTDFISRWSTELRRKEAIEEAAGFQDRKQTRPNLITEVICSSVLNKPVYKLQVIGDDPSRNDLAVIVIGRPAGCFESASSYVCQGLLDFTLSHHPVAAVARDYVNLTVFPMLDPDSTWVGNARTDLMGQRDHNHELIAANPNLYQAWRYVSDFLAKTCASKEYQRILIIELRVNSALIGARLIGRSYRNSLRMAKHLHLPRLLSRFSEAFYLEDCSFVDASKLSSRSISIFNPTGHDNVDSFRLEVSPLGYHKRSLSSTDLETFDKDKYLLLGRSLAFALVELTRSRNRPLPQEVARHLASFKPGSTDVDDLILMQAN